MIHTIISLHPQLCYFINTLFTILTDVDKLNQELYVFI